MKVEKSKVHPKYYPGSDSLYDFQYDIGLVQLSTEIQFSKNIHPICLPFQTENYSPPTVSTTFILGGWGEKEVISENNILSMVELPYFDFEECSKIFSMFNSHFNNKVLCAGGETGKDACFGDSGSPLVRKIGDTWIMDGVVSGGIDYRCGTLNPGVYANVIKYERWIKDNVYYNLESGQKGINALINITKILFGISVLLIT